MASHQRKRDLDKSTRTALSGLDTILAELADDHLKPGEFTARQVYDQHREQGGSMTFDAIRKRLSVIEERGDITSRRLIFKGTTTKAYRVP